MNYEIDFLGLNEDSCDADAICFRYFDEKEQRYIVGVYDGGTSRYGEMLVEHLNTYYFPDNQEKAIDFVICSHPDQDHASGLSNLIDNFKIGKIYMNRPWLYIEDLFSKVSDGRITKASLEERLRSSYPYIRNIEEKAIEKNIDVLESFQGAQISSSLTILSPTKDFYLDLIAESSKTPLEVESKRKPYGLLEQARGIIYNLLESWGKEFLREDVVTSPENETSVVVFGNMECENFLFTGDAGIRALRCSIDYGKSNNLDFDQVKIHQIPHHGGRHNVSPSILNEILGEITEENKTPTKCAFVSVGKGTDHPRKMVVNAYLRRGAKVFEARKFTVCHSNGMPQRVGWSATDSLGFQSNVEKWD